MPNKILHFSNFVLVISLLLGGWSILSIDVDFNPYVEVTNEIVIDEHSSDGDSGSNHALDHLYLNVEETRLTTAKSADVKFNFASGIG